MKEIVAIIVGCVFVNNIVLAQFLGICPFIGVSTKVNTAIGMSGAVVFVITLATLVTWLIYNYVLLPLGATFLMTISFILIVASLVQMVEIILKKVAPALYQALGVFLPLITTNCAVLGVAILTVQKEFNLFGGMVYAFFTALGFALAMVVFAGIREQMEFSNIPKGMKGVPAALIIAGFLALSFIGFSGIA